MQRLVSYLEYVLYGLEHIHSLLAVFCHRRPTMRHTVYVSSVSEEQHLSGLQPYVNPLNAKLFLAKLL